MEPPHIGRPTTALSAYTPNFSQGATATDQPANTQISKPSPHPSTGRSGKLADLVTLAPTAAK